MAFSTQKGDNFVVMVIDRELSNAFNKCLGITDRVSPVLWELRLGSAWNSVA
jgi:hypothetical protein